MSVAQTHTLFHTVWADFIQKHPIDQLCFPKKIIWLNGAPGAGKGTHTSLILEQSKIQQNPIIISELLQTPEAKKIIDTGVLVGDEEVTQLLLEALTQPIYQAGAVIDGYPRSLPQAAFIKSFYDALNSLHEQYIKTPLAAQFPKAHFEILVLYVDEATSLARQLHRGQEALKAQSLHSDASPIRKTDLDPEKASKRYQIFKNDTFQALKTLEQDFPFTLIDANGNIENVTKSIKESFHSMQYLHSN